MHFLDYRKSLGIAINDEGKKRYFFTKIFNVLNLQKKDDTELISQVEYCAFCDMAGVEIKSPEIYGVYYRNVLSVLHEHADSLEDFFLYYMSFVNCIKDKYKKIIFYNLICEKLKESQIPFEIKKDDDGYFIFPCGAKELDDALVSQNLIWLEEYPKTRDAFISVLKDYSDEEGKEASEIADKFRKALERFFQEFFGGGKTLENYKPKYREFLEEKGVPAEIRNNLETLLQMYTNFINNYAKHHDKTKANVLEYIMYQTGNIMRLLITLKKES